MSSNRLGEVRDRSFGQQRYRTSDLNLVTTAIMLWNTVYLERAASALRGHGKPVDDSLLQYLSPLGWGHINLTGDYLWRSNVKIGAGKFRSLRPLHPAQRALSSVLWDDPIQAILDRWSNRHQVISSEPVGKITPTRLESINLWGVFRFPVDRYADQILPSRPNASITSTNG